MFCVIGRAGASQTRRLITRLSVDWRPPAWCPSGTGLGLGTRVACRRFTPTRVVPPRGGVSSDTRWQPMFPLRESTRGMRCRRREGQVPGHSPHQGDQCSRHSHPHLIGVLAARHEWSIPCAQADRRLPTAVLDGFGQVFPSPLEMATDLSRIAIRPCPFKKGPAGMMSPGLGDAPLGAPWATRICRGRPA